MRGALTGSLLSLRVDCTPSPSSRPQVGKFGTYYAKSYQLYMAECIRQLAVQKPAEPLDGDLAAVVEVVIQRPKTTKRTRPVGDVDNYVKGALDGATQAAVWGDDGQLMALFTSKRWTQPGEVPGVNITVGSLSA